MAAFRREEQGHPKQQPRLRPAVHDMIGPRLRQHYGRLQRQPLPRRLSELLDRLDGTPAKPPPPARR